MQAVPVNLRRAAPVWLAVVATIAGLAAAYLLKEACARHPWQDGFQYRRLCYNDLQPLFHVRGISQGLVPYRDVQVEYPVLTGMFMDVTGRGLRWLEARGLAENSDPDYFRLSSLALAPAALLISLKLRRHVTAGRLMLWSLAPPLILYAFHNWDLLAVGGAVWGLVEIERRRQFSSGIGLGLGAAAKLYPLFLLPAGLLERWSEGDRRGAARLGGGFLAAALVVNLPWMLAAWKGWLGVWTFHAGRYPDFGTVWFWIAHHGRDFVPSTWWDPGQSGYRDLVSVLGLVLFGAGSLWFLRHGWRRRAEGGYPVAATSLGILAVFLLVSKVHSPQYALWIVPLLVMLNVPRWLVAAYLAADLAVYVSGFYWFTVLDVPAPGWKKIFEAAVLARAGALAGLGWWALRARRLHPEDERLSPVREPV